MTVILIAPVLADKGGVPTIRSVTSRIVKSNKAVKLAGCRYLWPARPRGDQRLLRQQFPSPPGLAKRNGNLPPGLQKRLQRNGRLPPGLESRFTPFPVEVERRLPPIPRGCVRGVLDGQAVIYDPKTRIVLDVLDIVMNLRR